MTRHFLYLRQTRAWIRMDSGLDFLTRAGARTAISPLEPATETSHQHLECLSSCPPLPNRAIPTLLAISAVSAARARFATHIPTKHVEVNNLRATSSLHLSLCPSLFPHRLDSPDSPNHFLRVVDKRRYHPLPLLVQAHPLLIIHLL